MLQETKNTRQIKGEPFRRWFSDPDVDLIVWYDSVERITGFQLCYKHEGTEKALTWTAPHGFSHKRIDDGEGRPDRHKMTPVLIPDGVFDKSAVRPIFESAAQTIDADIRTFVCRKIEEVPLMPGLGKIPAGNGQPAISGQKSGGWGK